MLKSLSTQFAATLFFGPLGLAYCSVAAAVFLTLVLAVLFFSEVGILSLFIIWPVSILVGLVFVKLHNDHIRSSGSRLLLGPGDDEYREITPLGSWSRGVAVLALILFGGFIAFLYLPKESADIGTIVPTVTADIADIADGVDDESEVAERSVVADTDSNDSTSPTTAVIAANASDDSSSDNFAVIALPEREVTTVIIDDEGNVEQGDEDGSLSSERPSLTVDAPLVNLRRGPGTSFDIITTLQAGDELFEFARDGNWINVETSSNGYTGWIYNRLVR